MMITPGLHRVATFLGEAPDSSGGTLGAPRAPAPWVQLLRKKFDDHFWPQMHEIYMGPLNEPETQIRALQICFWIWVNLHD